MAPVEGHLSEAINNGAVGLRKGLATPRWATMDLQEVCQLLSWVAIVSWLIAFSIICIVGAFFMHRFERRLKRLTGPWMIGK
jgi:hypothetical protein